MTTIKKGDMFVTSWGYDQTNYDFIVVKSVSPTGKTVLCQRATLAENKPSEHGHYWNQKPAPIGFGDTFRLRVSEYNGKAYLRGSYPHCNDGSMDSTRLDGFSPVDEGRTYAETDSQFGH